jgi:hypothetical protein
MIQKLKAIWTILWAERFALFAMAVKSTKITATINPKLDVNYIKFIESLERDAAVENTEGAPVVDPRLN